MPETITVVWEPLGTLPGTAKLYYHETLLYTNSAGQQQIATCYATGDFPEGSTTSEKLAVLGAAAEGSGTALGQLACVEGSTTDPTVTNTVSPSNLLAPGNPKEVVATATDLSAKWSTIVSADQQISAAHYDYSPLTLNSNSAADTALTAAGISLPSDISVMGSHWSPAATRILPTTFTSSTIYDLTSTSTDGSGNSVVTVTEHDASGQPTGSVELNSGAVSTDVAGYSSGTVQNDVSATTDSTGAMTATMSGSGAVAQFDASATSVTMADGATGTLNGNNVTATLGTNVEATLSGTGNTVHAAGSGDLITASGGTVTVQDGDTVTISGSDLTIDIGTSAHVTVTGSNDVVVASGLGDAITIGGNAGSASDSIQASGATVVVTDNACVNVSGNNNNITAGAADVLGAYGAGLSITDNNSTGQITVGGNGQNSGGSSSDSVHAAGATCTVADNSNVVITETVAGATINAGAHSTFGALGTGLTVNVGANNDDGIYVGGNGQNASGSASDVVWAQGGTCFVQDNSNVSVNNNNASIYIGASDNAGAYGTGLTVYANSGGGLWVGANGTTAAADVVHSTNANIALVDQSHVDVDGTAAGLAVGSSDQLGDYVSTASVIVNGSNSQTYVYAPNVTCTVNGPSDVTNTSYGNDNVFNYGGSDETNQLGSYENDYNNGSYETGYASNSTDNVYNANSTDVASGSTTLHYGVEAYGFAGALSVAQAAIVAGHSNIGPASSSSSAAIGHGDAQAMAEISTAFQLNASSMLTGSRFDGRVITWSTDASNVALSGHLDASEEAAVAEAFSAWADVSGLKFVEVHGNAAANIQLGWADLSTPASGLVGATNFNSVAGHIQGPAVIALEDKALDPLLVGSDGQLLYQGTQAAFEQVVLHEIGHALGLGDNNNPTSIEYYFLDSTNRSISSSDANAILTLYGNTSGSGPYLSDTTLALLDQLASFAPHQGASAVQLVAAAPSAAAAG